MGIIQKYLCIYYIVYLFNYYKIYLGIFLENELIKFNLPGRFPGWLFFKEKRHFLGKILPGEKIIF